MRAPWLLLLALTSTLAALSAQSLKRVAAIDLPGPKGERFDYLTVDEEHQYLLSAHLGPGILYVIDIRTDRLVKAIPGVPGITGLEYVPGLQKLGREQDRCGGPSIYDGGQAVADGRQAQR